MLAACGAADAGAPAASSDTAVAASEPALPSAAGEASVAAASQAAQDGAVAAVATTSIIADLVANVGGDRVSVTSLLPAGADPHTFAPSPNEARAVADAQILFENGAGLEEWLDELIENAGGERPTVVVSEGVTPIEDFEHEDEHAAEESAAADEHADESATAEAGAATDEHADEEGEEHAEEGGEHADEGVDPHMWFDPNNVIVYVENIRDGLKQVDPDGAATYDANAASYIEQLRELDAEIEQQLAAIPAERRKLVTNHDTFGYFARRYDFEVVGTVFEGVSTEEEPSPQQVAELVERIRAAGVPAIFAESTVNARLAEQIADEAGVQVVTDLYTDALGEPGSEGDTYLKMMRFDVAQFVAALQ